MSEKIIYLPPGIDTEAILQHRLQKAEERIQNDNFVGFGSNLADMPGLGGGFQIIRSDFPNPRSLAARCCQILILSLIIFAGIFLVIIVRCSPRLM